MNYGGRKYPRTLSQRDVPGIPRSIIPILKDTGLEMISVGVNGGSSPPDVPRLFRWLDPGSGEDIIAMWHPLGYGCNENTCDDLDEAVYFEGMDSIMIPWYIYIYIYI